MLVRKALQAASHNPKYQFSATNPLTVSLGFKGKCQVPSALVEC
jgi:hypothetical protein